jgi:hypothetical protein
MGDRTWNCAIWLVDMVSIHAAFSCLATSSNIINGCGLTITCIVQASSMMQARHLQLKQGQHPSQLKQME